MFKPADTGRQCLETRQIVVVLLSGLLSFVFAVPAGQAQVSPRADAGSVRTEQIAPSSTVIPTDVVPLPGIEERQTFAENFRLRLLQKLPARFYFNASVESSFRFETNVFQFPTKRSLQRRLPSGNLFFLLNPLQKQQVLNTISLASREDTVFRILPNVTGGWTLTPKTRVYANYFFIRDSLMHNTILNTNIHSAGGGIQRDIPLGRRGNLQVDLQFRELWQLHQRSVFDFLPSLTGTYLLTPRTVGFVSALLQLRGRRPFQAPTREIDPFYTVGFLHQRGRWTFSSSATFVQNFRHPFRKQALIAQDNYSWILDFEIARKISRKIPGLQVFVRAEPIYNFHSKRTPGLAGMDFRLFYGIRMSFAKPALTNALQQIREQLEEQEVMPPPPAPTAPSSSNSPSEPQSPSNSDNNSSNSTTSPDRDSSFPIKESAILMPYEITASTPQPIHGCLGSAVNEESGNAKLCTSRNEKERNNSVAKRGEEPCEAQRVYARSEQGTQRAERL